ncbi:hypothetical protein QMK54_08390 [Pseudomonas sp. P5_109]|uniref:hypothetical protein n=1 Tax=Pseudomonas sp. P5_109 TaxID=3043441 RepID=UPI002A36EA3F|nr:hypothetical protein [Pseudomonas sp. P5_109]WPN31762.1 hypothetical protein QMK54_08390 [Pseudomonas sp. P5_109]
MGNLAGSRKSHSIKKDLEGIEHYTARAFRIPSVGAAAGCDLLIFKKKPRIRAMLFT